MRPAQVRRRLQLWVAWTGYTGSELARRLGCDRSQVSLLLRGKRWAGLRIASAIEREMGKPRDDGAVYSGPRLTARDWSGL